MKFVLNSLTYHNCPVEQRQKLTFSAKERHSLLKRIHAREGINEVAILQTCNRVEFYVYAGKTFDVTGYLSELIASVKPESGPVWEKFSRAVEGLAVVSYLFEVAAGLDSQMLGENQILSQVKRAYRESVDYKTSRFVFHRFFHYAFRAGKAVRTETEINCGAVSISLAAVEAAKESVDLSSARGLVLGAGENAELACNYLLKNGLRELVVANRNKSRATRLTRRLGKGKAASLKDVPKLLSDVDLLICSTGSAEPVVKFDEVQEVLSHRDRPILILDIAVPRDVQESINQFSCVEMLNIDDLSSKVETNVRKRDKEIPKAKRIVQRFTDAFIDWYDSLAIVPAIKRLSGRGSELARREAERYAKDFSKSDREKLEVFAEALVKKMLHEPIRFLKGDGEEEFSEEQLQAVDLINKLFFPKDAQD